MFGKKLALNCSKMVAGDALDHIRFIECKFYDWAEANDIELTGNEFADLAEAFNNASFEMSKVVKL